MEIDFIMIYLTSFLRILLNNVKKVIVVTAAARISLTGSARKTANTLFEKKFGSRKISGISMITIQKKIVYVIHTINCVKNAFLTRSVLRRNYS